MVRGLLQLLLTDIKFIKEGQVGVFCMHRCYSEVAEVIQLNSKHNFYSFQMDNLNKNIGQLPT